MNVEKNKEYNWKENPLPTGSHMVRLKDHEFFNFSNVKEQLERAEQHEIPTFLVAEADGGEAVKLSLYTIESESISHRTTLKANLRDYTYVDFYSPQKALQILNNIQASQKFGI
jgi:hypothetical protein